MANSPLIHKHLLYFFCLVLLSPEDFSYSIVGKISLSSLFCFNFISCLSQSKCRGWWLSKTLWILLRYLFSLLFFAIFLFLKNIFVDFWSTSNCSSQCKGKIFIADPDVYHFCNKRKWEWSYILSIYEFQEMHNRLMLSHSNILIGE